MPTAVISNKYKNGQAGNGCQKPDGLDPGWPKRIWDRLKLQSYAAIRQRIDLQCKLLSALNGATSRPAIPSTFGQHAPSIAGHYGAAVTATELMDSLLPDFQF